MSGDEQTSAVAEAFRSHAGLVERVLRRAGVAERDLSDARQEVFIVVHRRLAEFEGRASLSTWLYRIALNVASDHRRRAYQRHERPAPEPGSGGEASDPCERLEQRELLEHALRALEALDPDKREAFVLAELYGLPMREVAAQLGCPQKTAFSRTYAARRRILAELHKLGALPLFPLLLPLRALRGLRLHAPSPAALVPMSGLVPAAGVSAWVVAGVLLAVWANRVPAARNAVDQPVRASAATPVQVQPHVAVVANAQPVVIAAKTGGFVTRPYEERASRAMRRTLRAAPVASGEPVDGEPADDMLVVRSGAVDVRPQLDNPLAGSSLSLAPSVPPRIRVRGPSDPADGVEQALDADPLFAYPIALD